MNKPWKAVLLIGAAALALSGCRTNAQRNAQPTAPNPTARTQSTPAVHTHPNDTTVIPSYDGPKVHTTNEFGGTSYGLGSSVYSMIGSSGLHSEGLSSHLESRIGGSGIDGVRVFAVDDMVILAAEQRKTTGSQYDPMQQKVLSPHGGQSGRGPEPNSPPGTLGSGGIGENNLDTAASRVRDMVGGNVKIYTVTGTKAVDLIDRIRRNTAEKSVSADAVSDNIRSLLNLALERKK